MTTTSSPAFESPHPDIWEVASAAEAGFDADALSSAFEYAMTDGFYSQAALLIKDGKLVIALMPDVTVEQVRLNTHFMFEADL